MMQDTPHQNPRQLHRLNLLPLAAALLLAICLAPGSARAAIATFKLDINGGNGPTQSGWTGFDITDSGHILISNTYTQTFTDALGAGHDVTVALSDSPLNGSDDGRSRDRGALSSGPYLSLSNMLRDFYGARSDGETAHMVLTLDAGHYAFTSYHHDAENNLANYQDVTISRVGGKSLSATIYSTSSPSQIVIFHDSFTLDTAGTVEFTVHKDGSNGGGEFGFNGFVLESVPTPAALPAGLALLSLGVVRRRRRA